MSGPVGDNVYRASGVIAASGGGGGAITWSDTIQTSNFSADSGSGYFVNTTSGEVTVTLPSSPSLGDTIAIVDYAATADTNKITLDADGNKIDSLAKLFSLTAERGAATIVYTDSTQGWLVHSAANIGSETLISNYDVQYLVVAGGGGSSKGHSSGGGAGGYRTVATKSFSVQIGTSYPITVAAGGGPTTSGPTAAPSGTDSVFSTITSAGGGGGIYHNNSITGAPGGSGGGGGTTKGDGNVPPTSPSQGNDGGAGPYGSPNHGASGGGGAGAVGSNGSPSTGGAGGNGSPSTISGTDISRGGGGGGATGNPGSYGGGGTGGGGAGNGTNGTANTGGGSGGRNATGGSGVVILRRETDSSTSTSGTVTTSGTDTIHTFNADGTFVG
jgi:hypothetical protein